MGKNFQKSRFPPGKWLSHLFFAFVSVENPSELWFTITIRFSFRAELFLGFIVHHILKDANEDFHSGQSEEDANEDFHSGPSEISSASSFGSSTSASSSSDPGEDYLRSRRTIASNSLLRQNPIGYLIANLS